VSQLDRLVGLSRLGLALAIAMTLVACSGSGSGGNAGAGEPVATSTVNLPPSYKFEPASISVKAGTTVTWTNNDNFTHSVQFKDGGLPAEPLLMQPGNDATFTFAAAGTYHYQCHLHPQNMQGTVTVTS
jgi:plastocyanin